MPHQCVRCGKFHEDGSDTLLKGCSCGSKFFFFVRKEKLEQVQHATAKINKQQRKEIEKDVMNLVGNRPTGEPVILDIESIRVLKPGKYEISLVDLFNKKPLVYKVEEGKYIIDLAETFKHPVKD